MQVAQLAVAMTGRNRYVDLLRATAIALVVVGHWLATSVARQGGFLQGFDALAAVPSAAWLTLLFQVIPVFFLAGGYANAASWRSHQRRGGTWGSWLHGRAERILRPTTVFIAAGFLVVALAQLAGADPRVLVPAAWGVAFQLWFLPVYLVLLALTPALHVLHRRWGLWVVVAFAGVAAGVDALVLRSDAPALGYLNYLLVWGVSFQLGFAWRDGTLTKTAWRPYALAVVGAGALVLLVTVGPFPVSMIGLPGARIDNTSPPSVALLAFAVAQAGVVLTLEAPVTRWLQRPSAWACVVRANLVIMTVYLWHMVPVIIVSPVLYLLPRLFAPTIGSLLWWALRPLWIVVLALVLLAIVLVLQRFERPRGPVRPRLESTWRSWLLLTGLVPIGFALDRLAVAGFDPDGQLAIGATAMFFLGIALVAVSGMRGGNSPRAERRSAGTPNGTPAVRAGPRVRG